ncbi:hypothetical protein [Legionella shakespearei]|uniref:hypothetical protein n=1 Tax=Legionella shakespearei TaxID=45075 RepID=UPI0012DDD79A|nr:hypothetical protein [Legionella shakespearei]
MNLNIYYDDGTGYHHGDPGVNFWVPTVVADSTKIKYFSITRDPNKAEPCYTLVVLTTDMTSKNSDETFAALKQVFTRLASKKPDDYTIFNNTDNIKHEWSNRYGDDGYKLIDFYKYSISLQGLEITEDELHQLTRDLILSLPFSISKKSLSELNEAFQKFFNTHKNIMGTEEPSVNANFEQSLKEALAEKNYLKANQLIEQAKTQEDDFPEKDRKEIILQAIYEHSNKTEYSLGFFEGEDDSFKGVCTKILKANPDTALNMADLYFTSRDAEIGVVESFSFSK